MEKKAAGAIHLGGSWNRRYCKVDEAKGTFAYFHKPNEKAAESVDLKLIQVTPDKTGKGDATRFTRDVGSKSFHFKAASKADAEKWINGLEEWKEWFLMKI